MQRSAPFLYPYKIGEVFCCDGANSIGVNVTNEATMNSIKQALQVKSQQEKESSKKIQKMKSKQKRKEKLYQKRLDELYRYTDKIISGFKKDMKSENCGCYELKQTVADTKRIGKNFSLSLFYYNKYLANFAIEIFLDKDTFDYYENGKLVKSTKTLGVRLTALIKNFICNSIAPKK